MKLKRYCVGFLFNIGFAFRYDAVLLIRKKRPTWQAGKLNGVGGHLEQGETPLEGMIREFKEETGATVTDWEEFARLRGRNSEDEPFMVAFFKSYKEVEVRSNTDEWLEWHDIHEDREDMLYNLPYLLRMAQDKSLKVATLTFQPFPSVPEN